MFQVTLYGYVRYATNSAGHYHSVDELLTDLPQELRNKVEIEEVFLDYCQQTIYKMSPYPQLLSWHSTEEQCLKHMERRKTQVEEGDPLLKLLKPDCIIKKKMSVSFFYTTKEAFDGWVSSYLFDEEGSSMGVKLYEQIELPLELKNNAIELSKDCFKLIDLVRGADRGKINFPIAKIANIQTLVSTKELLTSGDNGVYQGKTIEEWIYSTSTGVNITLYSWSVGYFEGYIFDLFDDKKQCFRSLEQFNKNTARRDWTATECLECGATYDEPGCVEPGQMGCDRCN